MGMITVILDDGSTLEVPAVVTELKSQEVGSDYSTAITRPAPHPDYRFIPTKDGWRAVSRQK